MKLVIATDSYLPRWDGISRFLSEIIPRLTKDYKITIIAPDFGKTPKIKGVKIEKIPLSKVKAGDFSFAKFQYFRIGNIIQEADVVFTQTIGSIGACAILNAKTKFKPLVSFIHSIEWELFPKAIKSKTLKKFTYPLTKRVVRFLYNNCKLLIVPSDSIADMLTWQKVLSKKKIVHLGVDTKKFIKGSKSNSKKEIGFKPRDFIIGYHGRLGREKDLKTLLRAYIRIRNDFPNTKLLIVGSGTTEVENYFKNQEGVIYVGQKENVIPYVQSMDIYIIPSLTETTSLSTLEAMSCEVPVIATRVGHIKDYINNGENGFFFTKQDTFDLVKKIRLLIKDSSLRNKIGSTARKTIIKQFKWEIATEKIIEGIKSISEKNK